MNVARLTWKQIPMHFAVHVLIGVSMFILVGIAALCLHLFVNWLATHELPKLMVLSAKFLEYALYSIDVLLFGLYVGRSGFEHGRLMLTTEVEI